MIMKLQDIAFIISTIVLIVGKKPRLFVYAGLVSLAFSAPLFAAWIFFTATRLTWYAASFFLVFVLWQIAAGRRMTRGSV